MIHLSTLNHMSRRSESEGGSTINLLQYDRIIYASLLFLLAMLIVVPLILLTRILT
jgi:hypothetical protein